MDTESRSSMSFGGGVWYVFRCLPIVIQVYLIGIWYSLVELLWRDLPEIHPAKRCGDEAGLTCVVTGGTEGIGLELVKLLLDYDCRVIVLAPKCHHAFAVLMRWANGIDTNNDVSASGDATTKYDVGANSDVSANGDVIGDDDSTRRRLHFVACDLSSRASVLAATSAVNRLCRRHGVDVLVNNAGVMYRPFERNAEGIEHHMAVNVVGHLSLTLALLPLLRSGGGGRVVNVSSVCCYAGCVPLADWSDRAFDPYAAYADSKLIIVLLTEAISKRLAQATNGTTGGVLFVSGHPGVVPTRLYRHTSRVVRALITGLPGRLLLRSPRSAARDLLFLCFADTLAPGAYYEHGRAVRLPHDVSKEDKRLVWQQCLDSVYLSKEAEKYWESLGVR